MGKALWLGHMAVRKATGRGGPRQTGEPSAKEPTAVYIF
jgi:hypothetical protein